MPQAVQPTPTRRELSEREVAAWLGLLYAHSTLVKQIDAELLTAHRLPLSAHEILLRLRRAEDGHLSISQLAGSVLVSPSRVSRLVDELANRGLVERRACPTDARVSHILITDEGAALLDDADSTLHAAIRRNFTERLSSAEIGQLGAIWAKLNGDDASC
jgi:DNA-binding MarR family transcriptional regulator